MLAQKQFIEDAIKGGFDKDKFFGVDSGKGSVLPLGETDKEIELYLLSQPCLWIDPEAWQAVGKTRGWEDEIFIVQSNLFFIGIMAKGLTIEEALGKLST
jgi:hypothetical protein